LLFLQEIALLISSRAIVVGSLTTIGVLHRAYYIDHLYRNQIVYLYRSGTDHHDGIKSATYNGVEATS